jgi:hypothetical protein
MAFNPIYGIKDRHGRSTLLPYKQGIDDGSTLSLDFTTGVLDPRLTFSRSTNATFINSQGLVEWAGANIVLQSGDLSQNGAGQWITRTNLTVSGWTGFSDPFGGSTAVKIIPNDTNGLHYVGTADLSMAVGISVTASVYVKASGYSMVGLVTTNANSRAHFDLSNQTSVRYGVINNRTITDVGGGWYRITMSFNVTNGPLVAFWVTVMNTTTDPAANSFAGATGSSDGVLAWGAQINPGSSAQPYYGTTTTAYHAPRFDYDPTTGQPRGLLIEGTSNNLARYSQTLEDTGSFWGYNETTRTPELFDVNPTGGTGSTSFAPSSDGNSRYAGVFLTGQTTASIYTYSVWLKGKGTNQCIISIQSSTGGQNATMTILSQPAGANASIAGNGTGFPRISNLSTTGWTRVQVVLSANLGGTGTLNVFMYPKDTAGQTTSDSIFAWGAQLEAGSGASSYIPTGASTGSRAFDYCEMGNITPVNYSTTNGSMLYEGQFSQFRATSFSTMRTAFCTAAGAIEAFGAFAYGSTMYPTAQDATNTALATISPAMTINTNFRAAWSLNASLASGEVRGCINGGSIAASGAATPAAMNATATPTILTIGGRPGYGLYYPCGTIKRVKYWPTTLSDETLQSITT